MKITVDRNVFAGVLDNVGKFVPRTHLIADYEGVELKAEDGQLYVRAGDEIRGMQSSMPAEIEEEGLIVVKHATLSGLIKNYQTETTKLQADEKKLTVGTGKSKYTLGLINVEKFLPMPEIPADKPNNAYGVGNALRRCGYNQAVKFEDNVKKGQEVFTNVYIASERCVSVSPDAVRMAVAKHESKDIDGFMLAGIMLPYVREFDSFELKEHNNWLFIYTEKGVMYVRKTEGEYPVDRVLALMNREPSVVTVVKRKELLNALNRLRQVCDTTHVRLVEDGIELTSQFQAHKGEEKVACQIDGEEWVFVITPSLFIDTLKTCTSEEIELGFVGSGVQPIYIYDGSDVHVIMSRTA